MKTPDLSGLGKLRRGRLLLVDSGAYSDYGVVGFFVVLSDVDVGAELEKYLEKHPTRESPNGHRRFGFDGEEFLQDLIGRGFLRETPYSTLHLGSYGSPDEVEFYEGPDQ